MKLIHVVLAGVILAAAWSYSFAQQEDRVTITTYYPAPYGVYKNLRLYPTTTPTAGVDRGVMFFNTSDDHFWYYANSTDKWKQFGSGGGGSGSWAEDSTTHAINNTNAGMVIIDGVPGANGELFHIHGDTRIFSQDQVSGEGSILYIERINGTNHGSVSFVNRNGTTDYVISNRGEPGALSMISGGPSWFPYITLKGQKVGIGTASPTERLDVSGNIKASGSAAASAFFYSSDASLKRNIRDLPHGLDKVLQLQGRAFNWESDGRPDVGLIAQDVEKVFPELVATDKQSGLKSVEYGNLVAVLIEAIKEQQAQIWKLETEIARLKKRVP